MASIEDRLSSRGRKSWRVVWREGGTRTGARDSETCYDRGTARRFRGLVEAAGDRRPEGYPKGCHGLGIGEPQPEPQDAPPAPTLTQVEEAYFEKGTNAAARQVADYRRLYQRHLMTAIVTLPDGETIGPLGGLPITEITTEVIQAWITWMSSRTYISRGDCRPYSAKTILNIHGTVIAPVMAFAVTALPVAVDPCIGVRLPQSERRPVTLDQVPTGEEIQQWIALAYLVSEIAGDVVTLAMGTGLRWAEMTALRARDVNLTRRTLTVAGAIKEDAEARRLYRADYGKTPNSMRTIRMPSSVVMMLTRRAQGLARDDLIFRGARGGIFASSSWHHIHWSKVVNLAAERAVTTAATAHTFRHAHATELLGANVSLDTVSKRLGHKSVAITSDIYGHLAPEADQRAVDVVDRVMTGA